VIGRPLPDRRSIFELPDGTAAVPVFGRDVISGAGVAKGYYKRDQATEASSGAAPVVRSFGPVTGQSTQRRHYRVPGPHRSPSEDSRLPCGAGGDPRRSTEGRACRLCLDLVKFDGRRRSTSDRLVRPGRGAHRARLREVLKNTLPAYMIPSMFVEISQIPTTMSGKVDFAALAKIVPPRPRTKRARRIPSGGCFALVASDSSTTGSMSRTTSWTSAWRRWTSWSSSAASCRSCYEPAGCPRVFEYPPYKRSENASTRTRPRPCPARGERRGRACAEAASAARSRRRSAGE